MNQLIEPEKLTKEFPTITAGLKEVLATSWSLSAGLIDEPSIDYREYEDYDYNEQVISRFLFTTIDNENLGRDHVLGCRFSSLGGKVYFEYCTSGNLGFSFFKNGLENPIFLIWKLQPSGRGTLTKDFAAAGWRTI